MATLDTVIVDLQVGNKEAVSAIEQATDRLAELKAEEAALRKQRKEGEVTEEAYLKTLTQIREETERQTQAKRTYTQALKDNIKQEKAATDSLNGLRGQLKTLIKEYDSLSKAEREGAKGKELTQHIQQVTEELSKAEQATGRFQRNVGNYESAIKNLPGKLNEWAMSLNEINKNGGQMSMTFGLMKNGASAFGQTLKILAKNPFFVILRVVIGLFTLLSTQVKKSDDAMTALQSVTAALKPVMDALKAALDGVVKVITAVANGLTTAISKLGQWLGLSRDSVDANQDLVKSMDALEDREREYTVGSAKRNAQVSELRAKAADRERYSVQERLAAIDAAMKLEKEDLTARRTIAREKLRLARLEAMMSGDTSDETKNRLAELDAAVWQAEQAYSDGMRSLQKQRTAFVREEAQAAQAARKARADAAKEAKRQREELMRKELEAQRAVEDATIALMEEGVAKQIALRRVTYERQTAALRQRLETEKNMTTATREALNQQLILMAAQYELDVSKISEDAERKRSAIREEVARKSVEAAARIEEIGAQAALQEMENDLTRRLRAVEGNAEKTAWIVEQEARRELEIARTKAAAVQQTNYETVEEYRLALSQAEAQVLAAEQRVAEAADATAEAMRQTKQAAFDAAMGMADAFGSVLDNVENLFSTLAESDERYADYATAMAYLQILVSTAVSIANAIQGATAAAAATGVAAPFTMPTFIAQMIAIVTGAVSEATALLMKSRNKPAYAEGGVVRGAGTGTSDSVTARVSNGESILTAKATAMFYDQLSAMNVAGGGRPFDGAGGRRFAKGGVVSTSTLLGGRQMEMMTEAMREAVAGIQPVVSVREIADVQRRVEIKEKIARQ